MVTVKLSFSILLAHWGNKIVDWFMLFFEDSELYWTDEIGKKKIYDTYSCIKEDTSPKNRPSKWYSNIKNCLPVDSVGNIYSLFYMWFKKCSDTFNHLAKYLNLTSNLSTINKMWETYIS